MDLLRKLRKGIDKLNGFVGEIAKYTIIIMMCCLAFEVISRYVFNHPTIWAQDVSRQCLAIMAAIGGAYAYLYNSHVRVDVFYDTWSVKKRAMVDIGTMILFFVFVGTIMVKGIEMAQDSWIFMERMPTVFAPPLYYIKTLLPIAAFLLLLQGIARLIHDVIALITGKSEDLRTMDY